MGMTSHTDLVRLPTPKELLGEQLFNDLQNLLIDIHRKGGSAVMPGEHPALVMDGRGGFVCKVDRSLTTVL